LKELITPKNEKNIRERIQELLVRAWSIAKPMFARMQLHFKVYPIESYFSTTGHIFWVTPVWRGEAFTLSILLHEGLHWALYPVDVFRNIKDIYEARRLLAEELHYQPKISHKDLWRTEEDWSNFEYSFEEFQLVCNILGDYIVNLWIHDHYPTVWKDLWDFLYKEGTFYEKEKALKRDTSFLLYLAAYPELIRGLSPVDLQESSTKALVPHIVRIVRLVREGRISTPYALKELVKIFHNKIQQDLKEQQQQGKQGEEEMKCPQCHSEKGWEIVAYYDEKKKSWVNV
jgi:hypothetical protein